MTTKHTPGPWRIELNNRVEVYGPRDVTGWPTTVAYNLGMTNDETSKANARLIAAAPEMLEALKMAQTWLDFDGRFDTRPINAAIAKAEGRE